MKYTKKLVLSALFTAFTLVATLISIGPIPPTNGYIHPGDALVLLCGFMLGPVYGGIAGAVGSALADITLGYVVYAPATLIIKFLVAYAGGFIYRINSQSKLKVITASVAGELIMIAGYYVYEGFIMTGGPGAIAALGGIPANLLQGAAGVLIAVVAVKALSGKKMLQKFFN